MVLTSTIGYTEAVLASTVTPSRSRDTGVANAEQTPNPLAGKTAVITGAGSGIGRALAQRLSAHGCPVAIVDADADTLAETAGLIEGPSLVRVLDVRDRQGLLALAADVREWAPAPIGAVFNNAGVALSARASRTRRRRTTNGC